jgi:hypothetical protein
VIDWESKFPAIYDRSIDEFSVWFEWAAGKDSVVCICNSRHGEGESCRYKEIWSDVWDRIKTSLLNGDDWADMDYMFQTAHGFHKRNEGAQLKEYQDTRQFVRKYHRAFLKNPEGKGLEEMIMAVNGLYSDHNRDATFQQLVVIAPSSEPAYVRAKMDALEFYRQYMGDDPRGYDAKFTELSDVLPKIQAAVYGLNASAYTGIGLACLWALALVDDKESMFVRKVGFAAHLLTRALQAAKYSFIHTRGERHGIIRRNALRYYHIGMELDAQEKANRNALAFSEASHTRNIQNVKTYILKWALETGIGPRHPIVEEYNRRLDQSQSNFGERQNRHRDLREGRDARSLSRRMRQNMLYTVD